MGQDTLRLSTFLTFNGTAEEAMRFYEGILPEANITNLTLFPKGAENGEEGKVLNGALTFAGQELLFMDMKQEYPAPEFSWATSLFVTCRTEGEFDAIFSPLAKDGFVMMGPEPVMDIRKCAWVTDGFGVTWQLIWR